MKNKPYITIWFIPYENRRYKFYLFMCCLFYNTFLKGSFISLLINFLSLLEKVGFIALYLIGFSSINSIVSSSIMPGIFLSLVTFCRAHAFRCKHN